MTKLTSDYERQVMKGMIELGRKLFPPEAEAAFDKSAQDDIAANKNRCAKHPDRETIQRIWPIGAWICDECAQTMWKTGGWPAGIMVFNMADRPEGWVP